MQNVTSTESSISSPLTICNLHILLFENFTILAAVLDIAFTWNARCTMDSSQIQKNVLKMVVAVIWTIVLPIFYASSRKKYTCYSSQYGSWLGEWCYSSYMVAVALYLLTNALDMVLFLVPAVGRYIETSNYRVCTILSWWTQVVFLLITFFYARP